MGCCSLKTDDVKVGYASMALVCVPLALGGGLLAVLMWLPARVSAPVARSRDSLACLLHRNDQVIDRRLRSSGWRCAVSGVLLRRWPRLSGLVFRRFYTTLASGVWMGGIAGILGGALLVARVL